MCLANTPVSSGNSGKRKSDNYADKFDMLQLKNQNTSMRIFFFLKSGLTYYPLLLNFSFILKSGLTFLYQCFRNVCGIS